MNRRRDPASKTDALLWKQLANHDKANIPERATVLLNDVGIEQPTGAFDRLTAKYSSSKKPSSRHDGRSRNIKRGRRHDDDSDSSDDESDEDTEGSDDESDEDTVSSDSESESEDYDSDDGDSEDEVAVKKHRRGGEFLRDFGTPKLAAGTGGATGIGQIGRPSGYAPPQPVHDPMADRAQRQFYMNELMGYQRQGYQLSIALDESTPTYVLKTEYDLIQENQAAVTGVQNLRAGLTLTMRGLEMANDKLNSPLPLGGWTDNTIEQNPTQFDRPLRRIYNMYLRNSFNHPLVELGTALAFSGAGYMLRNVQSRTSQTELSGPSSGSTPFQGSFGGAGPMGGSGAVPRTFGNSGVPAEQQGPHSTAFADLRTTQQRPAVAAAAPRIPPTPQGGGSQSRRSLRPPFTATQQRDPGAHDPMRAATSPMSAGQGLPVSGNIPVT